MGLVNCRVHGQTGIMPYASKAIAEQFFNREDNRPLDLEVVNVGWAEGRSPTTDNCYNSQVRNP